MNLACIVAGFHEDITDSTGKTISVDGYFTGKARKPKKDWRLYNARWSIKTGIKS